MFFSRIGEASQTSNTAGPTKAPRTGMKRALMFGALAAAVAAPIAAVKTAQLFADNGALFAQAEDTSKMSNDDLLKLGLNQLRMNQYEEAQATLQLVNADKLNEQDKKSQADALSKAAAGADQRKAARAEFELGEASLKAGKNDEAMTHYKAAADNKFADEGTDTKATEQMALAQGGNNGGQVSQKDLYGQAIAEYKAGNMTSARAKFQQLATAGYKPLFQKSPADYVKEIDQNAAGGNTASLPDAVGQPSNTTEPVATNPPSDNGQAEGMSARSMYLQARQQYRSGDWINARKNFVSAQQAGYKPHLFEDAPSTYLARMDRKEQSDVAHTLAAAQARNSDNSGGTGAGMGDGSTTSMSTTNPSETATARQALDRSANYDQILHQQRVFEAQQQVERGKAAKGESRYNDALQAFGRAVELDPSNDQAQAGLRDMQTLTGTNPAPATGRRFADEVIIKRGVIQYQVNSALNAADDATRNQNFSQAQAQLQNARVAVASDPTIFPPSEISDFNERISNAQLKLDRAQEVAAGRNLNQTTEQARDEAIKRREADAAERQRTVSELIRSARTSIEQTKYKEALGTIDQILLVDPNNDYAVGIRPLVYDKWILQEQRQHREDFNRNASAQFNAAEEKRIPYDDIYRYPNDWPDISARRDASTEQERGVKQEDQVVQAQLDRKLPELRFDAVGFSDVIDFLRDVTGANIFVNWRALEGAGVDKNTQVTARLRDVKFSKALTTILGDVGGGNVKLGYTIDEGVITISTAEDLSKNVVTRVYDIRDLIVQVPDFDQAPDFNLDTNGSGGNNNNNGGSNGSGGGSGGLGGGLFSNSGNSGGNGGNAGEDRTAAIAALTKLIQDTVASDSWRDNGGTVGSIKELSGQIIVTQTSENQRLLVNLLEQLRESRAIQVTVETRFLSVERNFLEDVGLDVDFAFNFKNPNRWSPIVVNNDSSTFTQAPSTPVPGSIGGSASGLTTSATFLDDFQVNLLLRATQASINSSLVTAPRVTLFNGQRAYVLIATQQAYVSNLIAVTGQNVSSFTPVIDVLNSGVVLDVSATVSADRKYVTLTLRPQLAVATLQSFSFQTLALAGNGGNDSGGGTVVATNAVFNNTIQEPLVQLTEVRTTVTVPDGGTLLLGGQTVSGEIERQAGVPILSKVPFLKRLFTNRSSAKDELVLLILVKPTIIIQREQEERQFPLLTSKAK